MKPQLTHKVPDNAHAIRLCTNDDWYTDIKVDGVRLLTCVEGEHLRTYNRKGERFHTPLDANIADWFEPFSGDWALDGELLSNGTYVLFDLIRANNAVGESTPFFQRRAALETLYDKVFSTCEKMQLVPIARTTEEKVSLCRKVAENHGEGVMFKHINGTYESRHRSHKTKKWKFIKSADLIVGEVGREGKLSAQLFAIDRETMEMIDVGSIAITGKRAEGIKRGDVVETEYLYLSEGNRLVQPQLVRIRQDKDPASCWFDQLEGTDKLVYMKGT